MNPFRTLKAKIVLLVLVLLLAVGGSLIFLSARAIESAMYQSEQKAAGNSVYLLLLNIENQHKGLLYNSNLVLDLRKREMKDLARVVMSFAEGFHQRAAAGLMDESRAKEMALEQIKDFRYGNNDYFFVYDENYVAVAHPDPQFTGKQLKDYRDAKGKFIVQELMTVSKNPEGGYADYYWKRLNQPEPVRKIGYAIFYPKWKWMIGTGLYVDDIDREYERKRHAILEEFNTTIGRISNQSGSHFLLFDGSKKLLIPSKSSDDQRHLGEFIAAVKTHELPFRYGTAGRLSTQAYIGYFQPLDWYLARIVEEQQLQRPGRLLVQRSLFFLGSLLLMGLLVAYLLATRISRPISDLAVYAKDLATRDFKPQPMMEELSARQDEVGNLAHAFAFMQRTLQEFLRHLQETTAAKERIDSELRIARGIQMSMLPKRADAEPDAPFDIFGYLEPARDVGGDFYDYFHTDKNHLCLVIGDVCDKGIPASLFMAVSKTLIRATTTIIRTYAKEGVTPEEVLRRVNLELNRDNEACMFVTIFIGLIDLTTGDFEYSNAGHNFPYWISSDQIRSLDDLHASPAGIRKNAVYARGHVRMNAGDVLLLYTDGVTEARNADGLMFSDARLKRCLSTGASTSAPGLAGHVLERVTEWRGQTPPTDDITLLAFEFRRTHAHHG